MTEDDKFMKQAFQKDVFNLHGTMSCSVCQEYRFSLNVSRDIAKEKIENNCSSAAESCKKVIRTWSEFCSHYTRVHMKIKNIDISCFE